MLTTEQCSQLAWQKVDNLMPVIVQHAVSGDVLMLGYMNPEALQVTLDSRKVTFSLAQNNVCGRKAKPPIIF